MFISYLISRIISWDFPAFEQDLMSPQLENSVVPLAVAIFPPFN